MNRGPANLLLPALCIVSTLAHGQTIDEIIQRLRSTNDYVLNKPCEKGFSSILTNRAANIFLGEKVGTYLSGLNDLSFRKNNVTYNSVTGEFAISHSFFQDKREDGRIRSFFVAGVGAVVKNLASDNVIHSTSGDLGAYVKQNWLGKVKVVARGCGASGRSTQQLMDAERAILLEASADQCRKQADDFELRLQSIRSDSLKSVLRKVFYDNLNYECNLDFADRQSQMLLTTNYFYRLSTHWTSLGAGIPLIRQSYFVAETYLDNFMQRVGYPLSLTLSHTRFRESPRTGRVFLTFGATGFLNNSFLSNGLITTGYADYKAHGGIDTLALANRTAFVGKYRQFVTLIASLRSIFFPADSHVGISLAAEQNLLSYKALNLRLGIPVVLIDKRGSPSANFELQVTYYDLTGIVFPTRKVVDKMFVGLAVGIPFSRPML
jgi:hypothetical protein